MAGTGTKDMPQSYEKMGRAPSILFYSIVSHFSPAFITTYWFARRIVRGTSIGPSHNLAELAYILGLNTAWSKSFGQTSGSH